MTPQRSVLVTWSTRYRSGLLDVCWCALFIHVAICTMNSGSSSNSSNNNDDDDDDDNNNNTITAGGAGRQQSEEKHLTPIKHNKQTHCWSHTRVPVCPFTLATASQSAVRTPASALRQSVQLCGDCMCVFCYLFSIRSFALLLSVCLPPDPLGRPLVAFFLQTNQPTTPNSSTNSHTLWAEVTVAAHPLIHFNVDSTSTKARQFESHSIATVPLFQSP